MSDGRSGTHITCPQIGTHRQRGIAAGGSTTVSVPAVSRHESLLARREGTAAQVHSWELVTAVDGPGTRLTVFLSGCPLRCSYCHNPDTMRADSGVFTPLSELVAKLDRYRRIFTATGGGLTISGGEPLFQMEFTRHLLRAAKERGIHTAIDTSGFLGDRVDDELLDDVDLVLLDVKSGDPDTYQQVTGRDLAPTLRFGERLARRGTPMWVRFVAVPGLTTAPDNVRQVAETVAAWQQLGVEAGHAEVIQRVDCLPFHNMGADKWAALGLPYSLAEAVPPTPDEMAAVREPFLARDLTTY